MQKCMSSSERLLSIAPGDLGQAPNAPSGIQVPPALLDSIRTYGILQPLLVRPLVSGEPDRYEVVAGFRRLQAAREVGIEAVPVRVYRVEDAALAGLYAASNQGSPRGTEATQSASSGTSSASEGASSSASPSARPRQQGLSRLLEDDLPSPPPASPVKAILVVGGIALLVIWAGIHIVNAFSNGDKADPVEPGQDPVATATPRNSGNQSPPTRATPVPSPNSGWQQALASVDGVRVGDVAGATRVIFEEPVFSQVTTVDENQKPRLLQTARKIYDSAPGAIIVVIGHTDNDPIRPGSRYESNDNLGRLRADAVVSYLKEQLEIDDVHISATSSGDVDPPFSNANPADKVRNRTVTLEVLTPLPQETP